MAKSFIGSLISGVVGIGTKIIETKDNKNKRLHDEDMADGLRIRSLDDNDAAYAVAKLKEQQSSIKDEVTLFILYIPAVLSFLKWEDFFGMSFDGPAVVAAGFLALGQAPVWYQGLFTSGAAAALGMNEYAKHGKRSRLSRMESK